jgi:ferredoxin
MPKITLKTPSGPRELSCRRGDTLRSVLRRNGITPHNGRARLVNCRGMGTCGTCSVQVTGEVSPPNFREEGRLRFPPHQNGPEPLRLSCQCRVMGDVSVIKYPGFWGQHTAQEAIPLEESD